MLGAKFSSKKGVVEAFIDFLRNKFCYHGIAFP